MNVAQALVMEHKNKRRMKKYNDMRFKLFSNDKFEEKNNFIEYNIHDNIKYFSKKSHACSNEEKELKNIRR